MTFTAEDLRALDTLLLARATAVIPLREVHAGNTSPTTIALRHDVDDNPESFPTAMKLARWERERGYRSTYYLLHTATYWDDSPFFRAGLEEIAREGHEIGIHVDAVAEGLLTGRDPHDLLFEAVDELREWGHTVTGAASHGNAICGPVGFVNYEQFVECAKDDPCRTLVYRGRSLRLEPMSLKAFGLAYEAYHIPRGAYLTDTGGGWQQHEPGFDFEGFALGYGFETQMQVLMHSDWWPRAFTQEREAAVA